MKRKMLITQKQADFILLKKRINLMNNKEHLTLEGLHEILAIRVSLNLGFFWWMNKKFYEYSTYRKTFFNNNRSKNNRS